MADQVKEAFPLFTDDASPKKKIERHGWCPFMGDHGKNEGLHTIYK
jgi:hypothetical protein